MARTRTPSQLIRPRLPVILIPRSHRRIRRYRLTQEKRRRPFSRTIAHSPLSLQPHAAGLSSDCQYCLTISTARKKKISAALRSSSGCFTTLCCCRTQPRPFADCRRRRPYPTLPPPPCSPPLIPHVFARGAGADPALNGPYCGQ